MIGFHNLVMVHWLSHINLCGSHVHHVIMFSLWLIVESHGGPCNYVSVWLIVESHGGLCDSIINGQCWAIHRNQVRTISIFKAVFILNFMDYHFFLHKGWNLSVLILIKLVFIMRINHVLFVKKTWYMGKVLGLKYQSQFSPFAYRKNNFKNTFQVSTEC
jgi:hypothetical protein